MTSITPTPQQVISLYRSFIRNASKFNNYNFKHYFLRRSRDAFQASKTLQNSEEIIKAFQKAQIELNILERQSKISQMYTFEKTVVEPLVSHHRISKN